MNLVEKLVESVEAQPHKVVVKQLLPQSPNAEREFRTWTNQEFLINVFSLKKALLDLGVQPGDRVAVLSNTRPEWLLADFAIMAAAGVVVSVYQTLTAGEVEYILKDSDSKIVFAENTMQVDKLLAFKDFQVEHIISFEACADERVIAFQDLLNSVAETGLSAVADSDLASLVYTSGTTGNPKGVMQTHANHLANIRQTQASGIIDARPSFFLFLPLAHSFAKLMAYLGILADCSLVFPSITDPESSKFQPDHVTRDLSDANVAVIPIVPRILEKMQTGIEQKFNKNILLRFLLSCSFMKNLIKRKLFGQNLSYIVSGGAKLPKETNLFFENLGVTVLQGYGLTETCVATNINRLDQNKIGTVGPVLDSTIELKITEEKEILFRGPNVTQGYWQKPEATAESWDQDGWFHTGDLGELDQDAYLSIIGRKKEIIVSSYGKKIAPLVIEARLNQSEHVINSVLFGTDRPYCVALIVSNSSAEDVQKLIERVNQDLASYEEIKKFTIISEDFTIENCLLTPTLKIRRNQIYQRYQEQIDALYT